MQIHINDEAARWYTNEFTLKTGDFVRFFARYGGCSTVQEGFSLGVSNEEPINLGIHTEKDGITYFIEEKDLWYFDGHDLYVDFNSKALEPVFRYTAE
ncbi:HesB/YadR/YfhF family protein [Cytobacillus spongiae]|uniref:HesB/YadR/YfhF family protein n=1 Tax=Cytobacillus spongiae TaxID=2901381 RepID=UPI001F3E865A|nr:HesB/YadR/YfhF family protein [Cytobacillus spongiae]UII54131.1 HesB/YadR/YfhF family protein [Cytobacillus spongiae]